MSTEVQKCIFSLLFYKVWIEFTLGDYNEIIFCISSSAKTTTARWSLALLFANMNSMTDCGQHMNDNNSSHRVFLTSTYYTLMNLFSIISGNAISYRLLYRSTFQLHCLCVCVFGATYQEHIRKELSLMDIVIVFHSMR